MHGTRRVLPLAQLLKVPAVQSAGLLLMPCATKGQRRRRTFAKRTLQVMRHRIHMQGCWIPFGWSLRGSAPHTGLPHRHLSRIPRLPSHAPYRTPSQVSRHRICRRSFLRNSSARRARSDRVPVNDPAVAGSFVCGIKSPLNRATPRPSPLMTADRRTLCAAFGLQALTAWKPDARSTLSG